MPSLIAKSPLDGTDPIEIGACRLSEVDLGPITSVAPFAGQEKATAAALKAAHGLGFPAPNRFLEKGSARCVWAGRGQAFVTGVVPEGLGGLAALTDQSDGWASLQLDGAGAEQVLARLVPVDLRARTMPKGSALRVPINHLMALLIRTGPHVFEILVFRSMAKTAWHELETAMKTVAARG